MIVRFPSSWRASLRGTARPWCSPAAVKAVQWSTTWTTLSSASQWGHHGLLVPIFLEGAVVDHVDHTQLCFTVGAPRSPLSQLLAPSYITLFKFHHLNKYCYSSSYSRMAFINDSKARIFSSSWRASLRGTVRPWCIPAAVKAAFLCYSISELSSRILFSTQFTILSRHSGYLSDFNFLIAEILETMVEVARQYNYFLKVHIGPQFMVLVSQPKYIEVSFKMLVHTLFKPVYFIELSRVAAHEGYGH